MTPEEPDDQGKTAPIEQPAHPSPPSASPAGKSLPHSTDAGEAPRLVSDPTIPISTVVEPPPPAVVRATAPPQQDVVFVPLAVNVGDGFKFGCGFFLAMVLAMLIGFVLLAALFALTSVFGLNLPISR